MENWQILMNALGMARRETAPRTAAIQRDHSIVIVKVDMSWILSMDQLAMVCLLSLTADRVCIFWNIDVNECTQGTHNCDINAICKNTNGDHMCQCKPFYEGDGANCQGILYTSKTAQAKLNIQEIKFCSFWNCYHWKCSRSCILPSFYWNSPGVNLHLLLH